MISSDISNLNLSRIYNFFTSNGIIKYAVVYEESNQLNGQLMTKFRGPLEIIKINPKEQLSRQLFPDQVENLNGYQYRLLINTNSSQSKNRIFYRVLFLFAAISRKQNATVKIISRPAVRPVLMIPYGSRNFDAYVSTKLAALKHPHSILLYNRNKYCMLIPKVKRFLQTTYALLAKYDRSTQIHFIIVSLGLIIVWKLFKNHGAVESMLMFEMKLFSIYVGQAASFNRKNRRILLLMLQIIVFMLIVMNVFSQRVIGLALSNPHEDVGFQASFGVFEAIPGAMFMVDTAINYIFSGNFCYN